MASIQEATMIFAAGVASQVAQALAQSMQSKQAPAPGPTSGTNQPQNFAADIDALMADPQNSMSGLASSAGAILGNLQTMGQGVLGSMGLGDGTTPTQDPNSAAQAYAAANTLSN
jgi:hypothetical protein